MELDQRALEIFKAIRCVDGESVNTTIEFLDSKCAREQRKLVRKLIRLGFNNNQIYSELNRLYGQHCLVRIYTKDDSDKQFFEAFVAPVLIGFPLLFLVKKFVLKR
ncbi:hypothetical protein pb186bvf_010827 [Paramecium bursaria]